MPPGMTMARPRLLRLKPITRLSRRKSAFLLSKRVRWTRLISGIEMDNDCARAGWQGQRGGRPVRFPRADCGKRFHPPVSGRGHLRCQQRPLCRPKSRGGAVTLSKAKMAGSAGFWESRPKAWRGNVAKQTMRQPFRAGAAFWPYPRTLASYFWAHTCLTLSMAF